MIKIDRRTFIAYSIVGGLSSIFAKNLAAINLSKLIPTPSEIEGPFYPVLAQKDKDFDLTKIEGKDGAAKGNIIFIQGRVLNTDGNPVEDATVDLWQANAAGRYRHPRDPNQAPIDPNFQGWAIVPSGKEGNFQFKTIYPGAYPASATWMRPPHIHFKVTKSGYAELITQMYFPGHKLNITDRLLNRKSVEEKKLMIAALVDDDPEIYRHNLILEKV